MSKIIRKFCDRCKVEITETAEQPDYMQALQSIYQITEKRRYGHIGRGEIDLCPACQKRLAEWLKEDKHESLDR